MKYCPPNCNWLVLTEFEQDKSGIKTPHWCNKYNKRVSHFDAHPNLYKLKECTMAKYTLMWTLESGCMMQHTVMAEDKNHALSLALSNSLINMILFDYLLNSKSIDAQVQQFLWLRDGRIC